jgi:hypothetical protein
LAYEEHSRQDVLSFQEIADCARAGRAQQPAMVQGWEFSNRWKMLDIFQARHAPDPLL